MIIVADTILLVLAFIAVGIAVKTDLKTREVPDWISYGLVASAAVIRLMYAVLTTTWSYVYYAVIGFLAMYLLGMLMFKTRQWGGGDAKLIMGLGIVFATGPFFVKESYLPFLFVFVVNTLLLGALYGIIYSVVLAYKNRKKFVLALRKRMRAKNVQKIKWLAWIATMVLVLTTIMTEDVFAKLSIMTAAMLILLYPYLWIFMKSIEDACLYRKISAAQLTEGDWVDQDIIINKKMLYKKKNTGIEKEDIKKLIKAKVKNILVKDGIPFTPTFLLSMLISLWNGGIASLI